ncbi:MAG: hypothetical protein ACR2NY_04260 [Alphaproteobacteria bacterium]
MRWLKKFFSYIFFFFHGAKDFDWRAIPKNINLDVRDQFDRTHNTIKQAYQDQMKKSAHLPPNFYLAWEGIMLSWRGRKNLLAIIFFPWLLATISSSLFSIFLPKSLLFNYGASLFVNFLLIALCVYPFAFWAIGENTKNKTLSLRPSSWNAQKIDFIIKIIFWLLIFIIIASSCFFIINGFFAIVQNFLAGDKWQHLITFSILLSYFLTMLMIFYFFACWLMFIPYSIFQSKFHLLSIKELYDLENFEDELKIFFGIIRQYHVWIFLLFLTILLTPILVSGLGLIFATMIYYAGNYITAWLPIEIRSNIIQVTLMNGVILMVCFVSTAIITIILSRGFWLLRYKKQANFPKVIFQKTNLSA